MCTLWEQVKAVNPETKVFDRIDRLQVIVGLSTHGGLAHRLG